MVIGKAAARCSLGARSNTHTELALTISQGGLGIIVRLHIRILDIELGLDDAQREKREEG